MDNMKINALDDLALEGVTGGVGFTGCQFSGKVRPEDCVAGKNYYVVMHGNYFYGQATGISREGGRTFLGLRTASLNGKPHAVPFQFNVELIEVYTAMLASC